PDAWRKLLAFSAEAAADGAPITPQVHGRTVSLLLGLQTFHPFTWVPSWSQVGLFPWVEQVERLPELRDQMVDEAKALEDNAIVMGFLHPSRISVLGAPPNYEPTAADSVAGIAAARGRPVWEVLFDLLLSDGGRELLNAPVLNYTDGNL